MKLNELVKSYCNDEAGSAVLITIKHDFLNTLNPKNKVSKIEQELLKEPFYKHLQRWDNDCLEFLSNYNFYIVELRYDDCDRFYDDTNDNSVFNYQCFDIYGDIRDFHNRDKVVRNTV